MVDGNNGTTVLTRVKYYKGQPLTAQDFQDEQKYHSDKLKLLLSRFPTGIIRDLNVSKSGTSSTDFGITIKTGIAVNANGDFLAIFKNQTVYVGDGETAITVDSENKTLTIPQTLWANVAGTPNVYVNLSFKLTDTIKTNSLCDSPVKNNRTEETVKITFDKSTDGPVVTIAVLQYDDDGNFIVAENSSVVVNAGIINEDQVVFDKNIGHDHSGGTNGHQISNESIPPGAITMDRLVTGARLPPTGPAGGDLSGEYPNPTIGQNVITINNLATAFKLTEDKITFDDTSGHNHSGVDENGTPIGSNGIDNNAVVSDKIAAAPEDGNSSDANAAGGNGIRTSHIRNKAVTLAKLGDDINFISIDSTAQGDLTGNYPNPSIAKWDGNSAPDDGTTGQGIRTSCIRNNAITSSKIAEWDGNENPPTKGITTTHLRNGAITANKVSIAVQNEVPATGFKNTDLGIYAAHIQPNAVTSGKIATWDPGMPYVNGIQIAHLSDGAVASNKISIAVESEVPAEGFSNSSNGIYAAHIQPKAVTLAKLGDDVNFINGDSEAGGDLNGTFQNLNITDGAVTSNKIAFAEKDVLPDSLTGIRKEHLRDGAVTENKLSIIESFGSGSVLPNASVEFRVSASPNCILQVFPEKGSISWGITSINNPSALFAEETMLEYIVNVTNKSTDNSVSVQFRAIKIGICPSSPSITPVTK